MRQGLGSIACALLLYLLLSPVSFSQPDARLSILDARLVGNVYGTVVDAATSRPIRGARIFLLNPPLGNVADSAPMQHLRGNLAQLDLRSAVRQGSSNERGEFLIASVPTPYPFKRYTIVIKASGYSLFIIDQARVLPGAVMALEVDCRLERGNENDVVVCDGRNRDAPMRYRHERPLAALPAKPQEGFAPGARATSSTVFATREGLVGGTTANGHVIVSHDHFVALPSRRALNPDDQTHDFEVELSWGGRTVRAPVWDVGPWNTQDDYWNPSNVRQTWQDLPEGTPEAQAAFLDGYNGGLDQFGRTVLNPAGIDLADGTFWDDLAMLDNEWISVSFLWRPGIALAQHVEAMADLNVRSTPAGTLVGTVSAGETGTITGGPEGATYGQRFYVWWNIEWDDGVTSGWSAENWLRSITQTPPTAPTNLAATTITLHTIDLSWQDNSDNEDGFKIERSDGATTGVWSQIALVGPGTTTHRDTGLLPDTFYSYRVRAFNTAGDSPYSNEIAVRTLRPTAVRPAWPLYE